MSAVIRWRRGWPLALPAAGSATEVEDAAITLNADAAVARDLWQSHVAIDQVAVFGDEPGARTCSPCNSIPLTGLAGTVSLGWGGMNLWITGERQQVRR
jgi:hypothetical protein